MTKVVNGFLKDSIEKYITDLNSNVSVESNFRYKSAIAWEKLKFPAIGQEVNTPLGTGEVIGVKYWNELQHNIIRDRERESLQNKTEILLGDVIRYFEYTVRFKEGDMATFDWSEYKDNFNKKR